MCMLNASIGHARQIALVLVLAPGVIFGRRIDASLDRLQSQSHESRKEKPLVKIAAPHSRSHDRSESAASSSRSSKSVSMLLFALRGIPRQARIRSMRTTPRSSPIKASGGVSKNLKKPSSMKKTGSIQNRDAMWPDQQGRSHRFIAEDDPTFQEYACNKVTGYLCKTPDKFLGTRRDGAYAGSYRVQYTLPGRDDQPQTLELLRSNTKDNPSFGAVKIKLPFDSIVNSVQGRIVVKQVQQMGNADYSRMRKGDIIRGMSAPETTEMQEAAPWWSQLGRAKVPEAENGIVVLDGKSVAEYDAVVQENKRLNGGQAEVVIIVERPVKFNDDDEPNFWGGFPVRARQDLVPDMVPIPIPVEKDPEPGFPPGLPRQPPNPQGGWKLEPRSLVKGKNLR